jgi:xylan 1,4-beta-xylosidase
MIKNPILPGFHPDPSICRVGDDYYIATSTFEWWPGVRIHHSKDLIHWKHCSYALHRTNQINLIGHQDSSGIWAPCLSHSDGIFWLIYTDVRSMYGAYKDTHNYLTTSPSIDGPWSDPIYLNSSGFDPSLFHDDDGRSWFVNQQWIHCPNKSPFNGILLQEYDKKSKQLIGNIKNIFPGTSLGVVEGPHLYKKNGYYYLLTAEGGTFYEHAVTFARSRSIDGTYEVMPNNPLLTSHKKSSSILQRAGHASLVETVDGDWYLAHLCGRPLEWNHSSKDIEKPSNPDNYNGLHCILGRETALQKMRWRSDDWLEVADGSNSPMWNTEPPVNVTSVGLVSSIDQDHFDSPILSSELNSLRVPFDKSWISLTERPGYLRLKGRESLMSTFEQSLIARRQQHFNCSVETLVDFAPDDFHQMAGLVAYYNTSNHAYLHITADSTTGKRILCLHKNQNGVLSELEDSRLIGEGLVKLKVEFLHDHFQFLFSLEEKSWENFGPKIESYFLSDEFATQSRSGFFYSFGFTGNYIGIACQDLSGRKKSADFDYLKYQFSS